MKVDYAGSSLKFIVVERPPLPRSVLRATSKLPTLTSKVVKIKSIPSRRQQGQRGHRPHPNILRGEGLLSARVGMRPGSKPDEVALVYKSLFDKVRIKKVTFINNKRFSDEKLKSALRGTRRKFLLGRLGG